MVVTPRYLGPDAETRYKGVTDTKVTKLIDLGNQGGRHSVGFWHMVGGGGWRAARPTICQDSSTGWGLVGSALMSVVAGLVGVQAMLLTHCDHDQRRASSAAIAWAFPYTCV
jgi:hypothetical protein